ncbi:hypothetical protein J2Z43_000593 [Clostridioides mangenotii]|uniref:Uncharacterized protein n=1 Tax=Metaclostridioides mangenotii TaxID=1540 RepID=A0ABS4E8F8_9FIRM|nr:hypothetical protein [Clostridioides mangenotii]
MEFIFRIQLKYKQADNISVEEADILFDIHIKMVFEGIRK